MDTLKSKGEIGNTIASIKHRLSNNRKLVQIN